MRLDGPGDRAAVAFSGGKDSLTLTALLAELTERPLLVATTSPVPWARDDVGVARERALAEIVKRLPVDVIEVRSDFRTCWSLGSSARGGYTLGINQLCDLPLFRLSRSRSPRRRAPVARSWPRRPIASTTSHATGT